MKKILLGIILLGTILLLSTLSATAVQASVSANKVCQEGKPECLDLVIEEMQRRYMPLLADCDHNAVFALNYLRTTEIFQQTANTIGYSNLASLIRQDALFADYYFRPFDEYQNSRDSVPKAWQITFDAAKNRAVTGSGNLALGINAHIQRDLPFVLYELYLQGNPVSYEDHTLVNKFLVQVNPLKELANKFDPTIDDADIPGTKDDLERFQTIVQWRDLAYRNYERLRNAKSDAERAQVTFEIEQLGALTATGLLRVFQYPSDINSSQRDAYCSSCNKTGNGSA